MHPVCLVVFVLLWACTGRRLFYAHSELPKLHEDDIYAVAPGPWDNANVPIVYSDASNAPDELVLIPKES